ncbi:MAG: radical SAM protein [Gemmatimonadales bacterium]
MQLAQLALLGEVPHERGDMDDHVPHVVAWNLTKRCNLECAHCYIAAGPNESADGELTTDEIFRITDQIIDLNSAPLFILSGGEPLLRDDLDDIARYAVDKGATVVVGTNGTLLTEDRIRALEVAGVTGVAVSVESLDPTYHDRFRRGHGSLGETLAAIDRLRDLEMDFVIQTTLTKGNRAELASLVAWAARQGAVAFNAYFLVTTGRGAGMHAFSPEDVETLLVELVDLHAEYMGRMMVRSKCAPQFMRIVRERVPDSPILKYPTRCPCGVHYCRVTPDGKLTACPYLPKPAGDLRVSSFAEIWNGSELLQDLRHQQLEGRCGRCEYRAVCGGCRARAYAETGNHLASDPGCVYEPDGSQALVEAPSMSYGRTPQSAMPWAPDAEARMRRIPSFVRGVVVERVEAYARRKGCEVITTELLQEVRKNMPVDFSKRLPFFMRHDD